ncbi:MAG: cellulose binding domain-containing protein [Micromonosporaceae bacterium]
MGNHVSPPPDDAVPRRTALARWIGRHGRLMAAAAAGFAVVAGFSFLLVTFALSYADVSSPAQDKAIGCADRLCGPASPTATVMPDFLPSPVAMPRRSARASRRHRHTATPSAPRPSASRSAPPVRVDIAYTADKRWDGGFQGELTISNHTSTVISRWKIAITLPGDRVSSVWNAQGQMSGDVLVLVPTSWDPPIRPGEHAHIFFVAQGPATNPASCTFNGAACA